MEINSSPAIKLSGIRKTYGDIVAVEHLDLEVSRGEILGLLGHNGSGKSTTIKMIMGLVKPTEGSINVLGIDVRSDPIGIKKQIGYVPEAPRIYEFLTALEFLDLTGDLYGMSPDEKKLRIKEFVEAFGLEGREGDIINSYSDGMKQKTAIISALMHRPKLLLLDEPLRGLDPKSARIMKDLLHELASQGVTVVISTHTLEIAQALCTRIVIMNRGRLLAMGTMDELRNIASMPGSGLEDIFLKLTGTEGLQPLVEALMK